ncbi:Hypothetical protein GLP15_1341 [Giardia lamblia P15]|uniref:Uncharacterized protein n=1 Tax=Giardia intestinalis (strain P15) TaxID=658858 RepID=E1F864_GIAIA|nr:Hypothetical protein GLP15_1341 [Giardia lamblia P15]
MRVLLLLCSTLANYSFVSPPIAAKTPISLVVYERTNADMLPQESPSCGSKSITCPGYNNPASQVTSSSICIYTYPYTASSASSANTCTLDSMTIPIADKVDGYINYLPLLHNTSFFDTDESYNNMYASFKTYEVNGKTYANVSELPIYGTAISPSGRIAVCYTASKVTVYFDQDTSSSNFKVLSGTDLFPAEILPGEMTVVSVDISDEFLIIMFGQANGGSQIGFRIFELNITKSTLDEKIKQFSVASKSTDMLFRGSTSGTKIGSFTANNCHKGSVALDKIGTKEYILGAIVTCPNSSYTYNFIFTATNVGTAFAFALKKDGTWLGQSTPLLLVPDIQSDVSLTDITKNYQFTTAVIQNGRVFLSGGSRVLYYTFLSSGDYSSLQGKTKTLSSITVFQENASPLTSGPEPGDRTSTVGPAMAFTYNKTFLVGIDSGQSPAVVLEYNLSESTKITKLGAIVNMSTPHILSPLGFGLDSVAIIDDQDRSQVRFARLPSAQPVTADTTLFTTSTIEWMTITAPTTVETTEEDSDFQMQSDKIIPRSRRNLVSLSYSNGRIVAFNPTNIKTQTVYIGNLSIYSVLVGDKLPELEINTSTASAGSNITVTYNTLFSTTSPPNGSGTDLTKCLLFSLQYTGSNIGLLPSDVSTKSYTSTASTNTGTYLSCTYTFQVPIYAHNYQVGLYSAGILVATGNLSVIPTEQATANVIIFNPSILRRNQQFSVSVIPGDKYGNRLAFADTRTTVSLPDCDFFKLTVYNISQYPEDVDYSTVSNAHGLDEVVELHFVKNGTRYCTTEPVVINAQGQYLFKLMDKDGHDLELSPSVMQSLVTWVNEPAGLNHPKMAWGVLVLAIALLMLVIFIVPFLLYKFFNRPPETIFKGSYVSANKGATIEEREAMRKKYQNATLSTSGQRVLPGIPLLSVLRNELGKDLSAKDTDEAAASIFVVGESNKSNSASSTAKFARQLHEIRSTISPNVISQLQSVKKCISTGANQYASIDDCSGCSKWTQESGTFLVYTFPATVGEASEPALVFASEFFSANMVETYVDQLTLWALLPGAENRLAIKGLFVYENKPIAGNKYDGIQSALNAVSLSSSHFVVVLAEPASLLNSPTKIDVQCIIRALKTVIFNCIPSRGLGGAIPLSFWRDRTGAAKLGPPTIMSKNYMLQGLSSESSADYELRCLIVSLVVLSCVPAVDYREVLECKINSAAIRNSYLASLYSQIQSIGWVTLHTEAE